MWRLTLGYNNVCMCVHVGGGVKVLAGRKWRTLRFVFKQLESIERECKRGREVKTKRMRCESMREGSSFLRQGAIKIGGKRKKGKKKIKREWEKSSEENIGERKKNENKKWKKESIMD